MPPKTRNDEGKPRSPIRRVYQEEAKTRQTSHWDGDFLPLESLERVARKAPVHPPDAPRPSSSVGRQKLALICIAGGILAIVGLLVLLFVFNRRPV